MSFRKISFDVKKLDKTRFYQGKNGALYCSLVIYDNDQPDQYGNDCVVKEDQTKEERERKERAKIVGNWKILGGAKPRPRTPPPRPQPKAADPDLDAPEEDDVPF